MMMGNTDTTRVNFVSATATKEPGFEAVFAIAGLLSIAYLLVLRRRK